MAERKGGLRAPRARAPEQPKRADGRDARIQATRPPEPAEPENEFPPNQAMLGLLGIRAKLTFSQPGDPDEHEADRLADAFVGGRRGAPPAARPAAPAHIQRKCTSCAEDETQTVQRKAADASPVLRFSHASIPKPSGGEALPRSVRTPYEQFFRADLSNVRVHSDAPSHDAAAAVRAHAFAQENHIFFARGRFDPQTTEGRRLLAHELTHTLQRPRAPRIARNGPGGLPADSEANVAAGRIAEAVRRDDISAAVTPLRGRSGEELTAMRETVHTQASVWLEQWLAARMNAAATRSTITTVVGAIAAAALPGLGTAVAPLARAGRGSDPALNGTAEEGIRLLWPVLPLIERLVLYDEGFRELEQAQLDTIRAASREQRDAAKNDRRLQPILRRMDAKEEYDANVLFDSSPAGLRTAAARVLEREEKDPLYDAILALAPTPRADFVRENEVALFRLLSLSELELVRSMARQVTVDGVTFGGNEVDALIARLRLATEGRLDDMTAVQAVVDRAIALLRERRDLRAQRGSPTLPEAERTRIDARLAELNGLDRLFEFRRGEGGELAGRSFMGLLSAARDNPDSFGADARRFAEFAATPQAARELAFQTAKQRIMLAGANLEGIRAVLHSTRAPAVTPATGASPSDTARAQQAADEQLRRDVLADPEVARIVSSLKGSEEDMVRGAVTADAFDTALYELSQANNNANDGQLFTIALRIARNESWRARYNARRGELWGVHANLHGERREIVEEILRTQRLPLGSILRFTGDVDTLRAVLAEMPEQQRTRLRLGWALSKNLVSGERTPDQENALREYREFLQQVTASQTTAGIRDAGGYEAVLGAALGSEPTAEELTTGEGRYNAAALMYDRQQARERLGRGASAYFTETDETMSAAAREFAALWLQWKDRSPRQITVVELATLSALNSRFENRAGEFADASNAIGEMAGMIAATVAGIVVIAATGGAATPAVIAIAAASGAGARVVTREMFGEDYYNSLGDQAARDALLGAVDGALAVVSASFAARGAQLLGLGGEALTSSAARMAGTVAEEATRPLARRVASSAVESALDGLLSGAVSEAFGAMTDERTWRRGINEGLVRVGQAALIGGLTGLAAGGVIGAVAPVAGAGARRLWEGVVGQSIENTLTRAGAGDTLAAARTAARSGDVAEANRLLGQLEPHLSPEQVLALRGELHSSLQQRLGRPPGTPELTPAERAVLRESGAVDGPLSRQHLDAEFDVVRRSDPQPSRTEGYVDEVDLGNGHSWKRRADGTWCRFTTPRLCGTVIPNAPRMSATARARAEASFAELQQLRSNLAGARDLANEYPGVVNKLVEAGPGPGGRARLDVLSDHERRILADVFPERDIDVEGVLLRDVRASSGRPGAEYSRLIAAEDAAILRLRESTQPLYDKVRAASPRARVRDRAISRARGLDEVSGLPPPSGTLQADHVVPVRDIVDMPGFSRLDWEDQVAVANFEPNIKAVDGRVNASRQDRSWGEPFPQRGTYSVEALERIQAREAALRSELQAEINRRLAAAGRAR